MEKEQIVQFKTQLERKRNELEGKIKSLQKVTDFGSDVDSLEEEGDESEEYGNQLSVAQTLKEHVADIDLALRKIEGGIYGKCEQCGEEISEDVLRVDPESRLCKGCKKDTR